MALHPIAKATLQAALISAGSNMLAQGISSYRDETQFELDSQALFQFTTSALVLSPLTFLWLEGLEATFPGSDNATEKENEKPKLNVKNTVAKIVVDQVVGGAWYTVAFIATMGFLRGQDYEVIKGQIQNDFWPILIAGFKLWPLVSILNFTVVPADKRLLVGNLFGLVWGIYLSLMAA
ncbi:Mpv17/PMP22 family protein [Aspergillus lucknowensis]|uniref:Integral membrane protein, Mpv17/PMP22 family n=1 Tax=Aspergillus lucknowensis TaxID=176173 RepID=A0ABR4M459_9EURO